MHSDLIRDQIKSQQSSHYISDVHGQKDQGQAAIKSTTLRLMIIFSVYGTKIGIHNATSK